MVSTETTVITDVIQTKMLMDNDQSRFFQKGLSLCNNRDTVTLNHVSKTT
jgi:hypothetical protein